MISSLSHVDTGADLDAVLLLNVGHASSRGNHDELANHGNDFGIHVTGDLGVIRV